MPADPRLDLPAFPAIMQQRKPTSGAGRAITHLPANPDGKGASGVLLDWRESTPRGVVAKPQHQLLAELFTSLLVLSARFRYKPAIGVANYLYLIDGEWVLSLIAPDEWSDGRHEDFVGTCVLQRDRTWTIRPSERLGKDTPAARALARFYEAFTETLDKDGVLEDLLPFHADTLSYYQRMNANALSRSMRAALTLGDQRAIPLQEWRPLLADVGGIPLLKAP